MNTQGRCRCMSKITENWLNTAVFGHMEHYNRSNEAPTESHNMSEHNMFSYNHSNTNKFANLPKRQAIAGQRTVRLLLVLNDAHNPINNPTVQIADPRKQNTLLPGNSTNDRRTILLQWNTILAIYSSWNYGRSLVLSDLTNIPRLISLHYIPTPLLFPFNNCTWKLSFRHTT